MTQTVVVDIDCTYDDTDYQAGEVAQVPDGFKKKWIRRIIVDSTEMSRREQNKKARRAARKAAKDN